MTGERPLTALVGPSPGRQWRTMQQLVDSGVWRSTEAARAFCRRHAGDLVLGRKGRALLVDQRSLDRLLEAAGRRTA